MGIITPDPKALETKSTNNFLISARKRMLRYSLEANKLLMSTHPASYFYFLFFLWRNKKNIYRMGSIIWSYSQHIIWVLIDPYTHSSRLVEVNLWVEQQALCEEKNTKAYYTVNPFYTDIRCYDKIRYNDNLNVTKPSLKRWQLMRNYARIWH